MAGDLVVEEKPGTDSNSGEKKTNSEGKKATSEGKVTNTEEKKTNSEEKKTNSEQKKTNPEEKKTNSEEKKNSSKNPRDTKASDDEDVPQDFFDDFSNPDFMEGLNIVDAWDDQGNSVEGSQAKSDVKKSSSRKDRVKSSKERKITKSKDRSKERPGRTNKYNDKHKSGPSDYRARRGSPRSRSKPRNRSRSRDKHVAQKSKEELRRDPEKTRRDMEKYKMKYEKTQEKKTITEKLKVVETGLVPPGMEMDVDISEVLKTTSNKNDTPVKDEKTRSKSKTLENEQQSRKPPVKRQPIRQESPSYDSKKSANLFRYGSRSPLRFRRSRSREYRRSSPRPYRGEPGYIADRHDSKSKPRMRRRSNSVDHNTRLTSPLGGGILKSSSRGRKSASIEKRRWARASPRRRPSRSRSREPRRRRSRSLSEREAWIRDSKRAWRKSRSPFSRDRDSPRRKRHRDMTRDPKKISFLEEIHQLLSGKANPIPQQNFPIMPQTIPSPMQMQNNAMPPAQIPPRPVPAPILISFPPQQPQRPLDMNFFIGDNNPVGSNMIPQQPHHNMVRPPLPNPIRFAVNPIAQPPRIVQNNMQNNFPIHNNKNPGNVRLNLVSSQASAVQTPTITTAAVQQKVMPLKIPTSNDKSNNTPIQTTVTKEEAAKLFESKKLALSDFLTITTNKPNLTSVTDLPKKVQVISRCQDIIKELGEEMKSAPLVVKCGSHKNSADSSQEPFKSPLLKNRSISYNFTSPQTQQCDVFNRKLSQLLTKCGIVDDVIIIEDNPVEAPAPAPKSPLSKKPAPSPVKTSKNMLMKMVQTLPYKCEECERRNGLVYVDEGVQCTKTYSSIGIQATEDAVEEQNFKNKSLASLTPAQLLMSETREEGRDPRERFNEKRFLRATANAPFRAVAWEDEARVLQFPWGDSLGGPSGDRSVPYVPGGGGGGGRMERLFPIQGREPPFPDRFRRY